MTRYLFLFLFASLVNANLLAQDRTNTILRYPLRFQAFGAPTVEVSALQGQAIVSLGGMGCVVVNKQFFLGGYGQSGHSTVLLSDNHLYQATLSQGGFVLGYIYKAGSAVHLITNARLGWASTTFKEVTTHQLLEQSTFITTPAMGVEMNVTRTLRVQLMGGYRLLLHSGFRQAGPTGPLNTNGLVGTLALSFGTF